MYQPSLELQTTIASLASATHLTAADWEDFLSCSDAQRAQLVQVYKDCGWMPSASFWTVALKIIGACVEVASLVTPIAGVVQAVYGVATLGRS
jgi:hypothetical protein